MRYFLRGTQQVLFIRRDFPRDAENEPVIYYLFCRQQKMYRAAMRKEQQS